MTSMPTFTTTTSSWPSFLIGGLYASGLFVIAPLSTAYQFCPDEGYEVMKALLLADGHILYSDIWSDQPPVHTAVLAGVFRVFGPSILAARLVTLVCTGLLVGMYFDIVRRLSGPAVAGISIGLLTLSQHFCQQAVSATIIIPAWTFSIGSLWLLIRGTGSGRKSWLIASGIAMGLGFQTKIAAGLLTPTLIFLFLSQNRVHGDSHPAANKTWRSISTDVVIWAVAVGAAWLCVAGFYPNMSIDQLLGTHYSSQTWDTFSRDNTHGALVKAMKGDLSCWLLALGALLLSFWQRDCRSGLAVLFLLTTTFFHFVHRPYWWYYYINLGLPLCWLASIAWIELIRTTLNRKSLWLPRVAAFASCVGIAILSAYELDAKVDRILRETINRTPYDYEYTYEVANPSNRDQFIVTRNALRAFHSRARVPPELAVWSRKRVAAGKLSDEYLIQVISKRRPTFIDKNCLTARPQLRTFLDMSPTYRKTSRGYEIVPPSLVETPASTL